MKRLVDAEDQLDPVLLSQACYTYNDMYADVPHERGTFLRRQVYEMVGDLQFEVYILKGGLG